MAQTPGDKSCLNWVRKRRGKNSHGTKVASASWLLGHGTAVAALDGWVCREDLLSARRVFNCALCLLPSYCSSGPVTEQSEKRVLCGLMGLKTQGSTAWWVLIGQNPAVSSASIMVSSGTKPLVGLRIDGFWSAQRISHLETLMFQHLCAGSEGKPFSYRLMQFLLLVTMAKLVRHCDWAFQRWSSSYTM